MADEYNEDYYNLLKQQNYEALLNKEVQLDNARKRALKQTNTNLGAMGMLSSGYGQTAISGIEGQYLNAMEQGQQDFQANMNNIDMQQQQALANDQYNNYSKIASAMSELDNIDEIGYLMDNYGLYTDGKFDYNKAIQLYGAENALDLKYLYETKMRGLNEPTSTYEYNDGKNVTVHYYDMNGKQSSIQLKTGKENGWNKENRTLNAAIATNSLQNNSYIALTNQAKNTIYVRYSGGKLYYVSQEEYNKANNKYYIITGHKMEKGALPDLSQLPQLGLLA